MRAALYARVSTTDKDQDVDMQLHELREFAQKRRWEALEFVDEGVSGARAKRPALDEMLKAVKARRVDVVIVWRLNRLGRNLSHLIHLLQDFQVLGVAFVSLKENIDMTTATGRLMAHLVGAFAEFELDQMKDNVRAGIENARRKGKRIGRKPIPPITLSRILELHKAKKSIRAIAKTSGAGVGTVQRTINDYKAGLIDADGLPTAPLFPEVFA